MNIEHPPAMHHKRWWHNHWHRALGCDGLCGDEKTRLTIYFADPTLLGSEY